MEIEMKITTLLVTLVLFLAACSPQVVDPGLVQTAIAQTEASKPTETLAVPSNTPAPTTTRTETPTITSTFTPLPTETPTHTPTPTLDLRVIDIDPQKLLLKTTDLPVNAKYYLPGSEWISPHRNSEILSGMGVDLGREYLNETGRVDGWWVNYGRGMRTVLAPEEIFNNVILFQTAQGAQILLDKYSNCTDAEKFTKIEENLLIGDKTNVCLRRVRQPNGENRINLLVEFTYLNVAHTVGGWGWEKEVELAYIVEIAEKLLKDLQQLELADKVTFKP
jgi:hypothetical protein